jgi:predicted kinase
MADVDKVIALMVANKEPKEKIIEFINNYKKQKAASKAGTETEAKEDDFVSSIPGLKEKLVKTQETKTPTVNIPSPKKTTATKIEEPIAETVAETTEQAVLFDGFKFPEANYRYKEENGKAAWSKSTDGDKTFEVVDATNIPESWFKDPQFKLALAGQKGAATYDEADFNLESEINQLQKEGLWNDNKKPSDSDPRVNPNDNRISTTLGKKYYKPDGSPMTNKEVGEYDDANRVDISGFETASKLVESLKDPAEWAQIYSNAQAIKKDIPLHLLNAWNSTQAFGMEYLKAEHKKRNLAYGIEDPEYEREINLWIANKYKEIETRKLLFSYDGKGIVSGVRAGDASDVISGVLNAVASTIETVGPAVLTRGASLFPQVTFPMYTDYNTIKAKRIYGDDPDAIEKLVSNNETEVALPVALGLVAVGLEKVGLGGITKHIASKPVKGVAVAKLLWVGSGEGSTEWAQLGVEKINTGLAEGKSIEESSALAWDAMSSDEGLEAFINGFIGSTTVAGGSNIINRALRNDNASIKDVNDKINNIADLNNVKYTTRNTDIRDAIDLEIKDAEQDLKKYIIEKRKLSEVLTDSEKTLLVNTLNEKTNIKQKAESLREQLENGDITRVEFGYGIRGLNNQDKRLSDKINEIQGAATNRAAGKITESVKEQIKKSGLDGNVIEMTSEEISNIQEEGFDSKTAAGEFGFIKQSTDGSFEIVLNKDKPMIGTAAHEFMHAVLFKTIGANIDLQNNLGDALIDHVSGLGGDKSILGKRLMSYGQFQKDGTFIRDDNFGEETITIMSEAIVDGSLKFEENFFTKIGDVVRRFSQDYLGKEIKFDTGRDVYNFVKDYSKSIKEGKVSKAILNVAKEGAKGKLTETATDTKAGGTKFSKEASDEVQRIYDEKGNAGVFDIIEQFKPIVNKIVQKRSEAPGFDRELLTSEIEIGKRGILDLVREYDPKSGVPLAAFINKYLPARAIEASRRILGEEFMDDVDTMVNIAGEEVSTETEVKPERKKVVLSDKLGVKSKVDSAIKAKLSTLDLENLNFKNLKDQTPEITGELFGIDPKKLISSANITKKELQSAQMFINKNADLLLSMLPEGATTGGTATGVPKTLLDAFYVKADRAKMAKTGSKAGLAIQVKKENISNKEFLEVFGIIDGKPVRDDRNTSARVLALANQTGKMMSNQAVRQELVNQGKPLSALSYIADGKATIMFSKQEQEVGAIDRSLSLEGRIIFWDGISDFANDDVLYTDKDSIKSGLIRAFADSPEILSKVDKLAEALYSVMSRLSVGIIKDPVKLTEKLLQTNNKQLTKIKEFFRSTVTATDAFRDKQRVKNFRATTIDFANKIFNPSDPGKSIAKILMLKGHLASSSRDSYLKRKQLFPDNAEFIKGTLESIPGIVVNTGKTKDGKTAITSIVYNEVVVTVPNITSSQASASALNDTKNANKLKERNTNEDIAQELLDEYTSFYADLYNSNKIDNVDLVMVSAALLSNMDSVLARAAKLMYITDNIYDFKDPGKEVKYEHMQPRVAALLGVWDAKINNKDSVNIKDLLKNYTIQIIPNTMDRVITESGLGDALFDGQKLSDPSWIRTFNEKTKENSKGRLRPLVNVYTKEILTPTAAFVKGANIIKEGLKENKIISKATMFSRPVNPAKGISVLDFDDTLATTKSGVRYTLPNPDGTPQPKKKVIFMAGGPGSGKSNVINQLGLKEQGFKVVNQDISLEWLMKNHGMPTDMREFTPEQASEFGKLSAEARGIALKKRIKYQGEGDGVVIDGTGASLNVMKKNIQDFKDKGYDVQMIFVETSQETALSRNKARKERSLRTGIVIKTHDSVQANKEAYKELFGERFAEVNTDNLKQGDVMPADVVNKVNDFTSGYIKGRLNAGEYATKGEELRQQGAEFDFSEFNQVVEGKTAPLFNKAMKLQEKFTSKDMFVLTARPAESNQAIFEFLQANGLNIPMENIIGLGSSASADKALWMAGKVGEGYNDFYFADDILENVQAVSDMLDQFDVKSKVQQAKRDFVLGDPKVTKLLDEKSMNDVKDVDGLANPGVYSNVKFSKSHRAEYENTVAKNRPDLSGKEVTATIDKMFDYIDGLDVPNKRKYEQITTKWLATSNIKLPEDSYKIQQAVEIAELKKEDIFSYKNPNEIIEKYAGTIKVKPISPVGIKEFTRATGFNDPITTEYGIVEYEVEETREAQQKVRDIVNTHWGPNSNPWCITKIDKDGNLSEDAWRDWTSYGKGPKRIVFQNGKLLAMKANYEYWGKMNKHSEGPIIQVKEGNVTNTTELVVGDGGIVDPIIRETRTVSKDGNTVTTNIFENSQDGYAEGTTIVENRIKGVKTKETRFDPDGSKVNTQEFNKKGKPTTSYQFNPNGKVKSVNGHLQQQAITEAGLEAEC